MGYPIDTNKQIDFLKNVLINGNFDIWQRGTSLTANSGLIADRWRISAGADGGTFPSVVHSRQALTPGDIPESFYFYRIAPNGAGTSLGANSFYYLYQPVEHGSRYLAGADKKVTVSFYARSSISNKKLGIYLQQAYGSGGSPSSTENIAGSVFTLTSSWVKYVITFSLNTLSGKTFGTNNNDTLNVVFDVVHGSSLASRVNDSGAQTFVGSGNIDIAKVKVIPGGEDLDIPARSFREELEDCLRYFQKSFPYATAPADAAGTAGAAVTVTEASSSYHSIFVRLNKPMRSSPSITFYNPETSDANKFRIDSGSHPAQPALFTGDQSFIAVVNNSVIGAVNSLRIHWTADAEMS